MEPGQPVPREADVVVLRDSKTYTARVDIATKRVVEFGELKGAQSAFLASEMFGADAYIKKEHGSSRRCGSAASQTFAP